MSAEEAKKKLNDAIKGYEAKLAALNALNSALQKENEQLRLELDEALQPKTETELEAQELKEEFARRLGEQQRTIDILKDTNQKLQAKVRDAAADSSTAEQQASSLQAKVAKQQQDISTLTARVSELEGAEKKLNSRARELEAERDKQASRVHVLDVQLQEAKQAVAASQQAASQEMQLLQHQHAEAAQIAQQELASTRAKLQEQLAAAQAAAAAGSEQAAAAAAEREAALAAALADAQAAAATHEAAAAESERRQRRAVAQMQDHIRQLESEKQELLSGSSDASTSLMRQIQALAQQASAAQASAAEQEQLLLTRVRAAEQAAAEATAAERDAAARAASAEAALAAAREAAAAAVQESAGLRSRLEAALRHSRALEAERNGAQDRLAASQAREQALKEELQQQEAQHKEQQLSAKNKLQVALQEHTDLQQQVSSLQQQLQLAAERTSLANNSSDRLSGTQQQQQQQQWQQQQDGSLGGQAQPPDTHFDPSDLQEGQQGMPSGLAGLGLEDQETPGDLTGSRFSLTLLSQRAQEGSRPGSSSTAALARRSSAGANAASSGQQQLQRGASALLGSQVSSASGSPSASQARLHQLSGMLSLEGQLQLQRTVQQLQQELSAATRERDAAAEQLYQMVRQADAATVALQENEKLQQQQAELQHKLDVAVEIIGERSLRIEELEDDIQEMKAIFRAQLDEAARQLVAAEAQANGREAHAHSG